MSDTVTAPMWEEFDPGAWDFLYQHGLVAHTTAYGFITSVDGEEVHDDYAYTAYVKRDDGRCFKGTLTRSEFEMLDHNSVDGAETMPEAASDPEPTE